MENDVIDIIVNDTRKEIEEKMKQLLTIICYGKENVDLGIVNFKETIEELNKRIASKTNNQKAGMIGELLFHLKSYEYLKEYTHISVYLNREERSVKKGFDVLLFKDDCVWYSEVKSRENADREDVTEAHKAKLNEAISDIKGKFKGDNKNYWLSAKTNIVNIEEKDLKKAIAQILSKDINEDKNVIGVSVVFKKDAENICKDTIKQVIDEESSNFENIIAVCITHDDYNKIVDMLKELENGNQFQ